MHPASATRIPVRKDRQISSTSLMRYIRTRRIVKRAYAGHVRKTNYQFVIDGNAPTDKSSISTLGHDPDASLITPFDDLTDFFRAARLQNCRGAPMILIHPIIIEWFELFSRARRESRKYRRWRKDLREVSKVGFSDRLQLRERPDACWQAVCRQAPPREKAGRIHAA